LIILQAIERLSVLRTNPETTASKQASTKKFAHSKVCVRKNYDNDKFVYFHFISRDPRDERREAEAAASKKKVEKLKMMHLGKANKQKHKNRARK